MKIEVELTPYTPEHGIRVDYDENYKIHIEIKGDSVVVAANAHGLVTLARALLVLSQPVVPLGQYIDFDEWSGLQAGSKRLLFVKSINLSN